MKKIALILILIFNSLQLYSSNNNKTKDPYKDKNDEENKQWFHENFEFGIDNYHYSKSHINQLYKTEEDIYLFDPYLNKNGIFIINIKWDDRKIYFYEFCACYFFKFKYQNNNNPYNIIKSFVEFINEINIKDKTLYIMIDELKNFYKKNYNKNNDKYKDKNFKVMDLENCCTLLKYCKKRYFNNFLNRYFINNDLDSINIIYNNSPLKKNIKKIDNLGNNIQEENSLTSKKKLLKLFVKQSEDNKPYKNIN